MFCIVWRLWYHKQHDIDIPFNTNNVYDIQQYKYSIYHKCMNLSLTQYCRITITLIYYHTDYYKGFNIVELLKDFTYWSPCEILTASLYIDRQDRLYIYIYILNELIHMKQQVRSYKRRSWVSASMYFNLAECSCAPCFVDLSACTLNFSLYIVVIYIFTHTYWLVQVLNVFCSNKPPEETIVMVDISIKKI